MQKSRFSHDMAYIMLVLPLYHPYTRKKQMFYISVIVKATNGPRYVVGCRRQLDKAKLKSGTRVALDMTTLTIMRLVDSATGTDKFLYVVLRIMHIHILINNSERKKTAQKK